MQTLMVGIPKKTRVIINKICEDVLNNQYNDNVKLKDAVQNLFESIPLQSTEFLVKRLFEKTSISIESQQGRIIERVQESLGIDFFNAFKNKYSELDAAVQRNAGMLLQQIIAGKQVTINGQNFKFDRAKILKFIINGILYTYRNERFHGDAFSPFKSSTAKIKTYANSYYFLISIYFILVQLIYKHHPELLDLDVLAESLEENTLRYNIVFKSQRTK